MSSNRRRHTILGIAAVVLCTLSMGLDAVSPTAATAEALDAEALYEKFGPLGARPIIGRNDEFVVVGDFFEEPGVALEHRLFNFEKKGLPWDVREYLDWKAEIGPSGTPRQIAVTGASLGAPLYGQPDAVVAAYTSATGMLTVESINYDAIHFETGPIHPNANFGFPRPDKNLHLASGQLDEDPFEEIVLAYWGLDEKIHVFLIEAEGKTPLEPGLAVDMKRAGFEKLDDPSFAAAAMFALAVGDFDGDAVDEIAIVTPRPHQSRGFGYDGFNGLSAQVYEVKDGEIVDVASTTFAEPNTRVCDGVLVPCDSQDYSVTARLNSLAASAGSVGDFNGTRTGLPREQLVVAFEILQNNACSSGENCPFPGIHRPNQLTALDPINGGAERMVIELTNSEHGDRGLPSTRGATAHPSALCLDVGNVDNTAGEEVVVQVGNVIQVFHAEASELVFDGASNFPGQPSRNNERNRGSHCDVAITDVDGAAAGVGIWEPEIVISLQWIYHELDLFNLFPSAWYATQVFKPSADRGPLTATPTGAAGLVQPVVIGIAQDWLYAVAMAPFDMDNDGIRAGLPTHSRYKVVQPQVILSMPPVHFDPVVLGEVEYDVSGCYCADEPRVPGECVDRVLPGGCDFIAEYEKTTRNETAVSHTSNSSFSLSSSSEACVGDCTFGIGSSATVSLEASFGKDFSSSSSDTRANAISQTFRAQQQDRSLVNRVVYDIFEYPLLQGGSLIHEFVCSPFVEGDPPSCDIQADCINECVKEEGGRKLAAVVVSSSKNIVGDPANEFPEFFLMSHEAGNLLSYKNSAHFRGLLDDQRATLLFDTADLNVTTIGSGSSGGEFTVEVTNSLEDSSSKSSIFSSSAGVEASGSIGVLDLSTSFTASYSSSNLSTQEISLTESDMVTGFYGDVGSGDEYEVTPYLMYRHGAYVLDFAVDFNVSHGSGSVFEAYLDSPDLALRLPHLYDLEKGLGDTDDLEKGLGDTDDPANRAQRTNEILVRPLTPPGGTPTITPGSSLELRTRVHNYSLKSSDGEAEASVAFHYRVPSASGEFPTPLCGPIYCPDLDSDEGGFVTELPLGMVSEQGTEAVLCESWRIRQDLDKAQVAAMQIFAEVSYDGAEVHKDNNVGWRPLDASSTAPPTSLVPVGFVIGGPGELIVEPTDPELSLADVSCGDPLTVTAVPGLGGVFLGWVGYARGYCDDSELSCEIAAGATLDRQTDGVDYAIFVEIWPGPIDISISVTGRGTVTDSRDIRYPLSCASVLVDSTSDCAARYGPGTETTFTATAALNSEFVRWGGAAEGCEDALTCTLTIDENIDPPTVTAEFRPQSILQVWVSPAQTTNGRGIVSGPGIECGRDGRNPGAWGRDCTELYEFGEDVSLTAEPGLFSGPVVWSGDCDETGNVTMGGFRVCTATFPRTQFELVVSAGGGSANAIGKVTSAEPGIDCGSDCRQFYPAASQSIVELTAEPVGPDSIFKGWTGICPILNGGSGDTTIRVIMEQDQECRAAFLNVNDEFLLTLRKTPEDGIGALGLVTSEPAGLKCDLPTCSAVFGVNTQVRLTATPSRGAVFDGFTGHPDCEDGLVIMDGKRQCTAMFSAQVLLVLDEYDSGFEENYRTVLNNLDQGDFDVWYTFDDGEPVYEDMRPYARVIWTTGANDHPVVGSPPREVPRPPAGPDRATEAELARFLDDGRCLYLTSQQYLDREPTSFMRDYLGIDTNQVQDNAGYTSATGVGRGFGDLAELFLNFGDAFPQLKVGEQNEADTILPTADAEPAFRAGTSEDMGAVRKDNGVYRTVFSAFPFEAFKSGRNRIEAMRSVLDYCTEPARNDDFESNESFESPPSLQGEFGPLDLVIVPGDVDFFKWERTDDAGITFAIEFDHNAGDLTLELYGNDRQLIEASATQKDVEQVALAPKASPGESNIFYLKVFGEGAARNDYAFSTAIPEPSLLMLQAAVLGVLGCVARRRR